MDTQYHNQQIRYHGRMISKIDAQPLQSRKEAQADVLELMVEPEEVAIRLTWMLDGNYGYAEQYRLMDIRNNKRCNRSAQAMQLLAYSECQCPQRHTIAAWNQLTKEQQSALELAIIRTLDTYEVQS